MIRAWGHDRLFTGSLVLSGLLLPVFLGGRLPLAWAVAAVTLFMLLDRVYSMAAVITIPRMFQSFRLTIDQMLVIGVRSLPLVFITSVFTGAVAAKSWVPAAARRSPLTTMRRRCAEASYR